MSFGHTIKINSNQIAKEFGKVTLIKIPGDTKKAIMVASKYVNWSSFWINPNWDYQIKSGKNYSNDYGEISADELLELFGANDGINIDPEENESYLKVEKPKKIEGNVDIDFN